MVLPCCHVAKTNPTSLPTLPGRGRPQCLRTEPRRQKTAASPWHFSDIFGATTKTNKQVGLTPTTYKKSFCSWKQPQPKKGGRRKILDLCFQQHVFWRIPWRKKKPVAIPKVKVYIGSVDAILCKELWGSSHNNHLTWRRSKRLQPLPSTIPIRSQPKTTTAMIKKMSKCPKIAILFPLHFKNKL